MDIENKYEFRLVADNSREGRLKIEQPRRSYQLMRIPYARNTEGKVVWTGKPIELPHIVERSQMERIEILRRASVKKIGIDPLGTLIESEEESLDQNPYLLLRRMLRKD